MLVLLFYRDSSPSATRVEKPPTLFQYRAINYGGTHENSVRQIVLDVAEAGKLNFWKIRGVIPVIEMRFTQDGDVCARRAIEKIKVRGIIRASMNSD